ncbi:MAG: hypothetical protein PHP69_02475 [Candidatus Omnitrophica bacterium]|nr:hypothetical protein [Candidatus Omnitrophota bacterium]MDD5080846.1 hypothetical protein [Candidatus Omnitrophota bacterium]
MTKRIFIIIVFLSFMFFCMNGFAEYEFSERFRDPFDSLVSDTGQILAYKMKTRMPKIILNGVLFLPEGNSAIINNEVVREGEIIGTVKLIKITENSIVIEDEGLQKEIKIIEE